MISQLGEQHEHTQKALQLLRETTTALISAGLVLASAGVYDGALAALAGQEALFGGRDHVCVAETLDRIGDVYRSQRQLESAYASYRDALDIALRIKAQGAIVALAMDVFHAADSEAGYAAVSAYG